MRLCTISLAFYDSIYSFYLFLFTISFHKKLYPQNIGRAGEFWWFLFLPLLSLLLSLYFLSLFTFAVLASHLTFSYFYLILSPFNFWLFDYTNAPFGTKRKTDRFEQCYRYQATELQTDLEFLLYIYIYIANCYKRMRMLNTDEILIPRCMYVCM